MNPETQRAFEAAIEIAFERANLARPRGRKPGAAAKRLERKLDAAVAAIAPAELGALIGAMDSSPGQWAAVDAGMPPGIKSGRAELRAALERRRKRLRVEQALAELKGEE